MVEFAFYLYLITILSSIEGWLIAVSFLLVGFWFMLHVIYFMSFDDDIDDNNSHRFREKLRPYLYFRPKKWIALVIFLQLSATIIPSKEIGYIFLGLKFTESVYTSNQNDVDELTKLAMDNLKQILKNNLDAKSDKTK